MNGTNSMVRVNNTNPFAAGSQPLNVGKRTRGRGRRRRGGRSTGAPSNDGALAQIVNAAQRNSNRVANSQSGRYATAGQLSKLIANLAVNSSGARLPRPRAPRPARSDVKAWAKEAVELLAAYINPGGARDVRIPDGGSDTPTATYKIKYTTKVTGVGGAAVDATANKGRFCYIFNPIIADAGQSFSNLAVHFQQNSIDGIDAAALWPTAYIATAGNPFCVYKQDINQVGWINSNGTGDMIRCRPVSASVLASYDGDVVGGAGDISMACVPGGLFEEQFANLTGAAPKAINWEILSDAIPGTFTGKLVDGGYTWWRPDSTNDLLLRNVMSTHSTNSMVNYDYPLLVCSGQINDRTKSSLLLTVFFNYEYTTNSQKYALAICTYSPQTIAMVHAALKGLPTSMANDAHIDWIKAVIGGICGFAVGGPVGAALGVAAGAGVSLTGLLTKK